MINISNEQASTIGIRRLARAQVLGRIPIGDAADELCFFQARRQSTQRRATMMMLFSSLDRNARLAARIAGCKPRAHVTHSDDGTGVRSLNLSNAVSIVLYEGLANWERHNFPRALTVSLYVMYHIKFCL